MIIAREKNIEVLSNSMHISPTVINSFGEQLKDCYDQLEKTISLLDRNVVLIIYFISAKNEGEYYKLAEKTEKAHSLLYQSPLSIIAQPPTDGSSVNIEIYHCAGKVKPEFKNFEEFNYCTIIDNNVKYLVAGGLQLKQRNSDPMKQSMESFRLMKGILSAEGMEFSHIFRQWNYIESITESVSESQHYQIFNDVRSLFYSESDFIHGYPAATGIGMNTGGVIVDFLASTQAQVWPIKNPKQIDAHKYSDVVLANNKYSEKFKKSTPKFERAKGVSMDDSILVYISGTAAIKGEVSLARDDSYQQTLDTIDNLLELVDRENLIAHNIPIGSSSIIEPISFRIYVKKQEDIKNVKSAFKSRFGKFNNVLYLIGDICRSELLLEIEGAYRIRKR